MIRTALEFVRKELESYIVAREQDPPNYSTSHVVELKSLVNGKGEIDIKDTTHITLMLVGVDEERREGKRSYYIPADDKQFLKLNPPVEIDLLLLFIAHNQHYETALRDLSSVIAFFQSNPVFDAAKFPTLNSTVTDPDKKPWQLIERLSFTLNSMTFEQQNNLWSVLGSKYMPSVVYRAKMLTIFETKSKEKVPSITELNYAEN